ncbi:MAG: hypothetical protein IJ840_06945 [Bacteroidales bacterium]|nr:hypothetical protein [Bacteroidales bacterium]
MNNIFKYSILAALLVAVTGLTACQDEELSTDQYEGKIALAAIAPNPVMRGGQLRIIGANLDKVTEVRFAGGASVTSIEKTASGDRSEIRVIVPLEGTETGPVTVVGDGLTASTRFDLEYTEPMAITSFSPSEVLSGDVVTVRGEYLNNVREVILGGAIITTFNSQSRGEISFTVPSDALTGYVIIGDVNELEDQTTIPNQIYSATELVVGDPTVTVAETATYKSGDVITVSGSHLDMIESVDLAGAQGVEFSVSEDGSSITFNLPPSATDGQVTLTSFAGKEFSAGEIETVSVSELDVVSLAEDERYKAGSDVRISGSDLDLVTKVEFNGAEAQWYNDGENIIATIPAEAKDGSLTVTLGSGKQAYTSEIEVVKPVAEEIDSPEAVAGQTEVVLVTGTDLDLVTSVTIGDKTNGLIDCPFSIISAETVGVTIPKEAYTGVLTLTAANDDFTQTGEIAISYDEAISIVFDQPSYSLGRKITVSGSNLMQVESITIKGKKVTEYQVRQDDAMSFSLPQEIASPGAYRLDIVLIDGTRLTWAVPFEVTAPFTEIVIWEGSQIINGWSGVTFGDDRFVWADNGIREGDVIKIYFTAPEEGWWDLQLCNGHWGGLSLPELDGGNEVKQGAFPGGTQVFSFNVTPEIIASLTEDPGWGGAFIINGDGNVEVTKISLIQYGATETVVWEDTPVDLGSWSINWELKPASMFVDAGLVDGMTLHVYVTPTADYWQIQFFDGHWGGMDVHMGNGNNLNAEIYTITDGRISVPVTPDIAEKFTTLTDWGYCGILQGENLIVNKISIE